MGLRTLAVTGIVLVAMTAAASAAGEDAVSVVRAEETRLHEELVLLRRIRTAQRELIEWARVSEGGRVAGLPPGICEASALRGLCPHLGSTFSISEEKK